jgi:Zn-dependent protease/CBS domain-containing protein
MKWSWRLGRISGIDVYMHATFLLLIGWVALSHWLDGQSVLDTLEGVAFILALFACVVAHEFGHALAARRFGIRTRDITLLPIGGLARLERMPEEPRQELWVALAGPAVNVVIAAILWVWLSVTGLLEPISQLTVTRGAFLERLLVVNLWLVGFNLLPAFPMDGGRVVRALLALRLDYTQATQIAANLGQIMAILFGFIGLFTNPFLVFIAFFVWIGAAQEASMVQMRTSLAGIPVSRAMITDFQTLSPRDTLERSINLILAGSQHDFPVVDEGQVVGILLRNDLLAALARAGQAARVEQIMRREFETADWAEMLEGASMRLRECGCHTMPVTRNGQLVGLLTMDNLGEFLMIQSALAGARRRAGAASW